MCTESDSAPAASTTPARGPAAVQSPPFARLSATTIIQVFAQPGHDLVVNRLSQAVGSADRRNLMAVGSWHLLLPGFCVSDDANPAAELAAPRSRARMHAHAVQTFGRPPDLMMDTLAVYGLGWRGASCVYSIQTDPWLLREQRHDLMVPTTMSQADIRTLLADLADRLVTTPARKDAASREHLFQAYARFRC